ncbi:MAG TPA: GNAT family N-acetyltransferase [Candidatus Paceibacterota bacterium]|nr:GNAT family N-acetyltransferase [Verrucomicrobiota bacterium]HRZ44165.1 GNAT family N-acetyltransferase [Candidatus Paceibacterota bacterium]HRZ91326.1 GNAT family N-acetyltransferase [Candidatus Paceibacterota bacterium]
MTTLKDRVRVIPVRTEAERADAMQVLRDTYLAEKHWVNDEAKLFPLEDLASPAVSWFAVYDSRKPVGVLRVLYDPPLELYREYGFKQLVNGLDVEAFIRNHRIAEIGRFAVLPPYRKFILVVAGLMRAASKETVGRGYTHYITDIFEGETHSPYQFHTRVMGFQPVATHDVGELNCPNRRITMVLDLPEAYRNLRLHQNWIYRFLTEDWDESLHQKLLETDSRNRRPASGNPLAHPSPLPPG